MESNRYDCRILLAVTGLSPQVVTETLYALAVTQEPPFVPTEIHLLTTREGAERARLTLLDRDSFSATVAAAQRNLGPAVLELRLRERVAVCGGVEVRMAPAELALYAVAARRCREGREPMRWSDAGLADELRAEYRRIVDELAASLEGLPEAMTKEYFQTHKAKVNRLLRKALAGAAEPYLIQQVGSRPRTRFGLVGVAGERVLFAE